MRRGFWGGWVLKKLELRGKRGKLTKSEKRPLRRWPNKLLRWKYESSGTLKKERKEGEVTN